MRSERCESAVQDLRLLADPDTVAGMSRFGISSKGALGVPLPEIRAMARRLGKDHGLALELWETGLHEAKLLASMVAEPSETDRPLMEDWVRGFDSWDVCDQVCSNLFSRTRHAYAVIPDWTEAEEEFVRRAGFVMMACLAVHDKKAEDEAFIDFFPLIERGSGDNRNFVKKAVNWAIRQIGKRNLHLRLECVRLAEKVREQGSPSARWIASDTLRELSSPIVLARLEAKRAKQGR
jgi:3-methyladenine DNA glycosylase AlkD